MWSLILLNIQFPSIVVHLVRDYSILIHFLLFIFFVFVVSFPFLSFVDLNSFEKLRLNMIHVDQLNVIAHHTGFGDGTELNHPKVAHNLLGYDTDCTSFFERTTPVKSVGDLAPEWPARYTLFKQYNILNKGV